jgi:hypothetical protein
VSEYIEQLAEEAARLERERIIKLLEEHTYYGQDGWLEFSDKALTRQDLEALIKGEQK